jgi:hypothetical protein
MNKYIFVAMILLIIFTCTIIVFEHEKAVMYEKLYQECQIVGISQVTHWEVCHQQTYCKPLVHYHRKKNEP